MAAVLYAPTIDPPNGALRAFLESGLLATLEDPEARRRLASLPSEYEDGADDELDAAEYVLMRIRPALERSLSPADFEAVLGQMDSRGLSAVRDESRPSVLIATRGSTMNRLNLILALLSFALAVVIFLFTDGARRWYSSALFVVLGAVMLVSARRGRTRAGE
jgi:hypothetical protein